MERVNKIRAFIKERGLTGTQTFSSRNIVGDPMSNIYDADGVQIDYCYGYDYLEIFGLTSQEYQQLSDCLNIY